MPEQYYKEALKAGQKEYRACIARGVSPVLPVLDDFVPDERVNIGIRLGTIQIPAEFIVGTKTRGRTTSFARNFMPILDEDTEFAAKWKALCAAHLKDGIRDPIKAYEYMNRYYVQEGNKRVSVLKFFDAATVTAEVIRVMPEPGTPESDHYAEFVEFNRVTHINYLEISKKGGYRELLRLLGRDPESVWTEEDRRRFSSVYHYFRAAFDERAGGRLSISAGDALLVFLKIYPYEDLRGMDSAQMKKSVGRLWEELKLQQEEAPIEVKLVPVEPRATLLTKVLTTATTALGLKVGFVHDKTPEASGWTHGHDQGRRYVERVFGEKIATASYFDAMASDPREVLERAIHQDKCDVLFTTSPVLLPASLRAAVDHPDILLLNCSINKSHRYVRTYYARIYEAKFIIGAVAGALCEDGRIGYVCDYPIYGQIAGINAFALGARMVNPRSRVELEWSSVGGRRAAAKRLADRGIRLISAMDNAKLYESDAAFGLYLVENGAPTRLAAPLWNWGVYYEGLIRQILNGAIRAEYESSSKAINYYWGMSAGVVDLSLSDAVPEPVKRLAGYLKEGISRWIVDPFVGPIHIQGGDTVGEAGRAFDLEEIISMDYLVENVVGKIPEYEELSSTGKATVESVGVEPAKKPEGARE